MRRGDPIRRYLSSIKNRPAAGKGDKVGRPKPIWNETRTVITNKIMLAHDTHTHTH